MNLGMRILAGLTVCQFVASLPSAEAAGDQFGSKSSLNIPAISLPDPQGIRLPSAANKQFVGNWNQLIRQGADVDATTVKSNLGASGSTSTVLSNSPLSRMRLWVHLDVWRFWQRYRSSHTSEEYLRYGRERCVDALVCYMNWYVSRRAIPPRPVLPRHACSNPEFPDYWDYYGELDVWLPLRVSTWYESFGEDKQLHVERALRDYYRNAGIPQQ